MAQCRPFDNTIYGTNLQPIIKVEFTEPVKPSSITSSVKINNIGGGEIPITTTLQNHDSVLLVQPSASLNYLSKYNFVINSESQIIDGWVLFPDVAKPFITKIDSSRKFTVISDNALLDLIQQQTFKYFWDYGHPLSGSSKRAKQCNSGNCNIRRSGFGVMSIVTAINRGFITRAQGLARLQTIVSFLKNMHQNFMVLSRIG
jgi:hypothetical protein